MIFHSYVSLPEGKVLIFSAKMQETMSSDAGIAGILIWDSMSGFVNLIFNLHQMGHQLARLG